MTVEPPAAPPPPDGRPASAPSASSGDDALTPRGGAHPATADGPPTPPASAPAPPPRPALLARPAARWAALTAAYTAGTLAFLWPLPRHLTTHIWGDRFDAWTTLWLIWHLADEVAAGSLTAVTDRILFPIGYNLWSFGHAALQAIGSALVLLGVPLIPAYNLLLVAGLVTSALAAHALGRAIGRSEAAGVVSATVFATSPYLYGEGAAGCIELVAAGLLPLFGLTLVHLVRDPRPRTMLASAAVLALIGPFNWYYTLFAGMFGVGFAVWQLAEGRKRAAALMAVAFVLAAATNAPLIPLVRRETPERPPLGTALFTEMAAWERARDLADGRLPLDELSEAILEEHDAMQVIQNSTRLRALFEARFVTNPLNSTPGALAFTVGLAGALAAGRRGRGWLVIAGGATALTLGPFLMVDDTPPLPAWSAEAPLPYAFAYEHVPFFSKAYRPYRIGVVTLLALAGGAAAGAGALRLSLRARPGALGVTALAVAGFTQPLWAGERPAWRPMYDATIPPIYTQLRDAPDGAVIELPLQYQPLSIANARFQYNQVAHRKPLLNCNQLIRRTDLLAFRDYVGGNGFLTTLLDLGRRPAPLRWTDADLAAALRDGFRWLVVHHRVPADRVRLAGDVGMADLVAQPALNMLRDSFGAPALSDADSWVFRLPDTWPEAGRTWTWTGGDVTDVATPWDVARFGIPLRLRAGDALPLHDADGPAVLSFWAHPLAGDALIVRTAEGDTPVALAPDTWTFVEVPTADGAFALAADQDLLVELTRVQTSATGTAGDPP